MSGLASSDQSTQSGEYLLAFFDSSSGFLGTYTPAGARQSFKFQDTSTPRTSVQGMSRQGYDTCNEDANAWDLAVQNQASHSVFVELIDRMTDDGCDAFISASTPVNPYAPIVSFAPIRH